MPGGNTRAATHFRPYPLAVEEGSGWRIWDADGDEFIDPMNNYTALVHGHRHPLIERHSGRSWRTASSSAGEVRTRPGWGVAVFVVSIRRTLMGEQVVSARAVWCHRSEGDGTGLV